MEGAGEGSSPPPKKKSRPKMRASSVADRVAEENNSEGASLMSPRFLVSSLRKLGRSKSRKNKRERSKEEESDEWEEEKKHEKGHKRSNSFLESRPNSRFFRRHKSDKSIRREDRDAIFHGSEGPFQSSGDDSPVLQQSSQTSSSIRASLRDLLAPGRVRRRTASVTEGQKQVDADEIRLPLHTLAQSQSCMIPETERLSDSNDPDEIIPLTAASLSKSSLLVRGVSCTLDTETGNSSVIASRPVIMYQVPSLSKGFTVMGAFKAGLFTSYFHVENVPYPDGIRRQSAVRGTLRDIVEWTSFFPGSNIIRYLLLCYRLCAEPLDLFDAFMILYREYQQTKRMNDEFIERCYVFLVQWILLWGGQDLTPDLRMMITHFAENELAHFRSGIALQHIQGLLASEQVIRSFPGDSSELESLLENEILSARSGKKKRSLRVTLPIASIQNLPENVTPVDILDYDTVTLCHQLTSIEVDFFRTLKVTEFLYNNWLRVNKSVVAPTLTQLSEHFNKVSLWVATLVIVADTMKRKIRTISKLLRVVKKLISMRNYSTACQIVTGITHFTLSRLHGLHSSLPPKSRELLEKHKELFDNRNNYKSYRQQSLHHPCIPLLPVHLRDIANIHDNQSNWYGEDLEPKVRINTPVTLSPSGQSRRKSCSDSQPSRKKPKERVPRPESAESVTMRSFSTPERGAANRLVDKPINLDKMNSLAMGIYNLYNMKDGMSKYALRVDYEVRDKFLTSITNAMDGETLYEASVELQGIPTPERDPASLRRSNSDNQISPNGSGPIRSLSSRIPLAKSYGDAREERSSAPDTFLDENVVLPDLNNL